MQATLLWRALFEIVLVVDTLLGAHSVSPLWDREGVGRKSWGHPALGLRNSHVGEINDLLDDFDISGFSRVAKLAKHLVSPTQRHRLFLAVVHDS